MQTLDRSTRTACHCFGLLVGLSLSLSPAHAETSAPPRISKVVITGNHSVPTERIASILKTRAGSEYDQETLNDDIRAVYKTRLFTSVRAETLSTCDGRVAVSLLVAELPSTVQEIIYDGAKHMKPDELEKVTGLRKATPLDPAANSQAATALLKAYHEAGRMWANVELVEGDKPGDTRVVFKITEGPIARVGSIEFTGNASLSSTRLRTVFGELNAGCGGRLGAVVGEFGAGCGIVGVGFPPKVMPFLDCEKLETYYKSFGFRDVRITRELRWSTDGDKVDLIFHIDEGKRDPETATQLSYTPGEVDVQYEIEEQPQQLVGQVILNVSPTNVITRQIDACPGQKLAHPKLRVAQSQAAAASSVGMTGEACAVPVTGCTDEDPNNPYADILIDVRETFTAGELLGRPHSDPGSTEPQLRGQPKGVFRLKTSDKPVAGGTGFSTSDVRPDVFFSFWIGFFH
jgi:hypothetical protein